MKAYKEVVRERYDGREVEYTLYDNPYSLINPVGFYGSVRIRQTFYSIFRALRTMGIDISTEKILDVGCGKGDLTRYFAELSQSPGNIYGIDLSSYRINQARIFNPNINYFLDDLVQPRYFRETDFGVVTAVDVFMHLGSEEEILNALQNIRAVLKDGGIFIWYDAFARDHFDSQSDAECAGFNPKQMDHFCKLAGFEKLFSTPVFKNIMWKYHSAYLSRKFPMWLVTLVENVLPGSPGNVVMVFRKRGRVREIH
ncbi:MAG: class I SAM-dependent methyltransferase [Desulfitobacterium hafniense]|nr:class I SAM-dependent methyltransferase [Desulfitobacterium hafniense]